MNLPVSGSGTNSTGNRCRAIKRMGNAGAIIRCGYSDIQLFFLLFFHIKYCPDYFQDGIYKTKKRMVLIFLYHAPKVNSYYIIFRYSSFNNCISSCDSPLVESVSLVSNC